MDTRYTYFEQWSIAVMSLWGLKAYLPVSSNVETLSDGNRTNAIKATQSPIPIASIKSQCPVSTHTQTIASDNANEASSAAVNRPQTPKEILLQLA